MPQCKKAECPDIENGDFEMAVALSGLTFIIIGQNEKTVFKWTKSLGFRVYFKACVVIRAYRLPLVMSF